MATRLFLHCAACSQIQDVTSSCRFEHCVLDTASASNSGKPKGKARVRSGRCDSSARCRSLDHDAAGGIMITAWKQPFLTLSKRANADRTLGGEAKLKCETSAGWKLCAGTVCDQASRNSAASVVCPDMRRTRKGTDASVTILGGLADGTAVDFSIRCAVALLRSVVWVQTR